MDRIMTLEIQQAIQKARVAKNMTREDLAQKAAVSVHELRNYENGTVIPKNEFILKLEKALGVQLPHAKKKKKVKDDE
jgi:ribosome-binding protein aMBF1 (putative translation factor)